MERTIQPMGNLIAYAPARPAQPAHAQFAEHVAEVFDLAAYAASGSRTAARAVAHPRPPALSAADELAAERLYAEMVSPGRWLQTYGAGGRQVILRVHDPAAPDVPRAPGTPSYGPEVA